MKICGHLYGWYDYINNVKYKHIISMYIMAMDFYYFGKFNQKNLLYIDGHPCMHVNIVGFINSCRCSLSSANYSFAEHFNDKELFMKMKEFRIVVSHTICSLGPHGEFLINYNFHRPKSSH